MLLLSPIVLGTPRHTARTWLRGYIPFSWCEILQTNYACTVYTSTAGVSAESCRSNGDGILMNSGAIHACLFGGRSLFRFCDFHVFHFLNIYGRDHGGSWFLNSVRIFNFLLNFVTKERRTKYISEHQWPTFTQ